MHHYLTTYVGKGAIEDPYRPRGASGTWTANDLRPGGVGLDGYALLSMAKRDDDAVKGDYLGDSLIDPSDAVKALVESRLGLTLASRTLRQIVIELLVDHASTDGTRWRPIEPGTLGYEIYVGGERILRAPTIRGGSTITESFNKADADSLGPDLTWTEIEGDIDVVSNTARSTTVDAEAQARADTDLATSDMYVQASMTVSGDAVGASVGLTLRKDGAATLTHLISPYLRFLTDDIQMYRRNAGSYTQLGSNTGLTLNALTSYLGRGEVSGTTLKAIVDGVEKISVTDSNITAATFVGKRCGLYGFKSTSGYGQWDAWEAADLAAATTRGTPFGTRGTAFNGGRALHGILR